MVPKGSRNLLVAGRCVSGDQAASSAFRVQASCMAMGQVAGAVAALSGNRQAGTAGRNIEEITKLLKKHNAIVP